MEIVETFVFEEAIFKVFLYLYFFIQKLVTSITQEWLVVEICLTPQWITFWMFYRLFYNIHSHLNDMILAWSALLQ